MKAVIDLSEVEDQLVNCKPGDEYTITFTVDEKTPEELTGTASEVEHLGDAENEGENASANEESPEEPSSRQTSGGYGKKVPKAILMVAK
jgi:hypothetical protein